MKVLSFRKAMPYLYDLCQARYVCYVMIHGILKFMHLMLFIKRIAYVFKNKISRSQLEES